jgi:hypothetical protein
MSYGPEAAQTIPQPASRQNRLTAQQVVGKSAKSLCKKPVPQRVGLVRQTYPQAWTGLHTSLYRHVNAVVSMLARFIHKTAFL